MSDEKETLPSDVEPSGPESSKDRKPSKPSSDDKRVETDPSQQPS